MNNTRLFLPLVSLSALLVSSCMVGPDFESPRPEMPESWVAAKPPASTPEALVSWWKLFRDLQLDSLISQARANNQDLKTAVIRIQESRAALTTAISSLLPSLDSSLGANRGTSRGLGSSPGSAYSGALDASWELDLFGGNLRGVESALASLYSTEADAIAIHNSLLAEVASTYFDWINYTEQLDMARQQLEIQKKSLSIAQDNLAAEFTSRLDVEQAKAQVASTEAMIPDLETRTVSAKNSLAILLGTFPGNVKLSMPPTATLSRMPTVPTGLPSDLLRRRPDIIKAELDLHAATANIGVAVSDLYPKFSLSGSYGSGTSDFSDWFRSHSSNWSLGSMVHWPVFSGGAIDANIKKQEAVRDRTAVAYQKALITAVNEVENALTSYANSKIQLRAQEKAAESARESLRLSRLLYQNGKTEFINILSAQQQLLNSEESVISTRQSIRQSIAELSKALGGGWDGARK